MLSLESFCRERHAVVATLLSLVVEDICLPSFHLNTYRIVIPTDLVRFHWWSTRYHVAKGSKTIRRQMEWST